MRGEYWRNIHWAYIAAMADWTFWDWVAAEGFARMHMLGRETDPTEATRSMAIGAWMAHREQRAKEREQ